MTHEALSRAQARLLAALDAAHGAGAMARTHRIVALRAELEPLEQEAADRRADLDAALQAYRITASAISMAAYEAKKGKT